MSQKTLKQTIEDQFDSASDELPVLNRVALELQKLQTSQTSSMDQIAALILEDQALASRVLQAANSAFYGGLKKVETISQALVRLGMAQVASLAMAASQAATHQAKTPMIALQMQNLWVRSLACAFGARWLAQKTGHPDRAEEAFLAGLLHDLGELFLLKVLDRMVSRTEDPLPLSEPLMEEVLAALHNDMGYRLMQKWELPSLYADIARDHHCREPDEHNDLLLMIRLMDQACERLGLGRPANPSIALAASLEAKILGLTEIKAAELEVMLEDKQDEILAMLHG